MSSVVIKHPPSPFVRIGRGGRPKQYHTLHFDNRVFTVQKEGTSVLSFRNKGDALRFGKLIESHFELTHCWPTIDFEDVLYFKNTKTNKLKFINTKEWKGDELRNFCIENYMNMLDIHNIENEYKLVGNSIRWDVPMSIYIDMLNSRL
jgi:hypothetical protein